MGKAGWRAMRQNRAVQPSNVLAIAIGLAFLLLAPSTALATSLPEEITEDTTLTAAGNPYTGSSVVQSGVTLKAEPGVEFSEVSLTVHGTLSAEGTTSEPIIVTESNGNYTPIAFEPGSGASVLNHVEVTNSGSGFYVKAPIKINKSSPTIKNSAFANTGFWTIWVTAGGSPEIADNSFVNIDRAAIYWVAAAGDTGDVNIHGNYIEGGKTDGGIYVDAGASSVTATTLSGNTIVGNESSTSFSFSAPEIPGDITENTLTENKSNLLSVSGTVAKSSTWNDGGTQVKIGAVTVAEGVTLKIEPSVYFRTPNFTVYGTLIAEGTAEEPIVFTEGNGNYTPIAFEPGSGASVLNHVEVTNSGSGFYVKAPIKINKSSPTIKNSAFANTGF
ncbi:MAG TPA: right-handed parallel beta-helix repeat-containing protein, partial [Solirubrobacterales bacterium]